MNRTRATTIGVSVSVFFHLCIVCSQQVRGVLFWDLAREVSPPEAHKLVLDLEAPIVLPPPVAPIRPIPKPQPPPPPQVKKFVDTPIHQKDAPAPKQSDLIGEKNSIAKDNAPATKQPDGMPNLDGKTDSFGVKNAPQSSRPPNPGSPGAMAALPAPATLATATPSLKTEFLPPVAVKTPPKEAPPKAEPKPPAPPVQAKAAPPPPVANKTPPPLVEPKAVPKPPAAPEPSKTPPLAPPAPAQPAETLAKGPKVNDKDVAPDGLLPRTAPGNVSKRPKPSPSPKIEVETKPVSKPMQVASLPAPAPPPVVEAPAPKPEVEVPPLKPEPPQKQMVNSRMAAVLPQPFIPPPSSAEGRKSLPNSSAGQRGEESFNIKQHEYAKYYKHITQKVSSTLDILYGGDMSLISPKPGEERVIVDFKILRTGEIADLTLVSNGGDYMLSSIILSSLRGTPLDPFPKYIKEDHLKIRYTFYFR